MNAQQPQQRPASLWINYRKKYRNNEMFFEIMYRITRVSHSRQDFGCLNYGGSTLEDAMNTMQDYVFQRGMDKLWRMNQGYDTYAGILVTIPPAESHVLLDMYEFFLQGREHTIERFDKAKCRFYGAANAAFKLIPHETVVKFEIYGTVRERSKK